MIRKSQTAKTSVDKKERSPVRITTIVRPDVFDMISWLTQRTSQGTRRKRKIVDLLDDVALFFESRDYIASRTNIIASLLKYDLDGEERPPIDGLADLGMEDPLDYLLLMAVNGMEDAFLRGLQDTVNGRLRAERKTLVLTRHAVACVERMQRIFEGFLGPITRSQSKTIELMLRIYYRVEKNNAPIFSDRECQAALGMEKALETLDSHFGEACRTLDKIMKEGDIEGPPVVTGHTALITEEEMLTKGYNPLGVAQANLITLRAFLKQHSREWCRTVQK
jgi:hypothetical protein